MVDKSKLDPSLHIMFQNRVVRNTSFNLFILVCGIQKARGAQPLLTPVPWKKARLTVSGMPTKTAFLSQS